MGREIFSGSEEEICTRFVPSRFKFQNSISAPKRKSSLFQESNKRWKVEFERLKPFWILCRRSRIRIPNKILQRSRDHGFWSPHVTRFKIWIQYPWNTGYLSRELLPQSIFCYDFTSICIHVNLTNIELSGKSCKNFRENSMPTWRFTKFEILHASPSLPIQAFFRAPENPGYRLYSFH